MSIAARTIFWRVGGPVLMLSACSVSGLAADLSDPWPPVSQAGKAGSMPSIVKICPECQQGDVPKGGGGLGTPKGIPAVSAWEAAVADLDVRTYFKDKWSSDGWYIIGSFARDPVTISNIFSTAGVPYDADSLTSAYRNELIFVAGLSPIQGDARGGGLRTGGGAHVTGVRTIADWNRLALAGGPSPIEGDARGGGL